MSAPAEPRGPVLVTGAAGFVGVHLTEHLLRDGAEVIGWFRPGHPPDSRQETAIPWTAVEILDADAVAGALGALRPTAIYHLAGAAHVGDSWQHTRETFEGNVLATHHLFQGLLRHGLRPRVLVSGSAAIYKPAGEPLNEESPLAPASPYATSKLAQELVAAQAWAEHRIPALLARRPPTSRRRSRDRSHRSSVVSCRRSCGSATSIPNATSWTSATPCARIGR